MQTATAMESDLSILVGQMAAFTDITHFSDVQLQTLKPTLKATLNNSLTKLNEEERFALLTKLPVKNRPRLLQFIAREQDKPAWEKLIPEVREKELEQLAHRLHVLLQNVTISTSLKPKLIATINADLTSLSHDEQTALLVDLGFAKIKRLPSLITNPTEKTTWQVLIDRMVKTEEDTLKARAEREAELLRQIEMMATQLDEEHEARLAAEQQTAALANHIHHIQNHLEAEQRTARLREQEAINARQAAAQAEAERQAAIAQQHAIETAARQALNERISQLHINMANLNSYQGHGQANTLATHSHKLLEDVKALRLTGQLDTAQSDKITQVENTAQRQHKRAVAIATAQSFGL